MSVTLESLSWGRFLLSVWGDQQERPQPVKVQVWFSNQEQWVAFSFLSIINPELRIEKPA